MNWLCRLTVMLPLLSGLAWSPALAESQSSNSSSNCAAGRCSRVDSLTIEDDRGVRRYLRRDVWTEGEESRRRQEHRATRAWPDRQDRRGQRDRDDDDDDH